MERFGATSGRSGLWGVRDMGWGGTLVWLGQLFCNLMGNLVICAVSLCAHGMRSLAYPLVRELVCVRASALLLAPPHPFQDAASPPHQHRLHLCSSSVWRNRGVARSLMRSTWGQVFAGTGQQTVLQKARFHYPHKRARRSCMHKFIVTPRPN